MHPPLQARLTSTPQRASGLGPQRSWTWSRHESVIPVLHGSFPKIGGTHYRPQNTANLQCGHQHGTFPFLGKSPFHGKLDAAFFEIKHSIAHVFYMCPIVAPMYWWALKIGLGCSIKFIKFLQSRNLILYHVPILRQLSLSSSTEAEGGGGVYSVGRASHCSMPRILAGWMSR